MINRLIQKSLLIGFIWGLICWSTSIIITGSKVNALDFFISIGIFCILGIIFGLISVLISKYNKNTVEDKIIKKNFLFTSIEFFILSILVIGCSVFHFSAVPALFLIILFIIILHIIINIFFLIFSKKKEQSIDDIHSKNNLLKIEKKIHQKFESETITTKKINLFNNLIQQSLLVGFIWGIIISIINILIFGISELGTGGLIIITIAFYCIIGIILGIISNSICFFSIKEVKKKSIKMILINTNIEIIILNVFLSYGSFLFRHLPPRKGISIFLFLVLLILITHGILTIFALFINKNKGALIK